MTKQNKHPIKTRSLFPDPNKADEQGVVCYGGEWSALLLLDAYRHGIFPWPQEDMPILWFSPDPRGVIFFEQLHLSKSFKKWLKKQTYKVTFNTAFAEVMRECQKQKRPNQKGTWILPDMIPCYEDLFKMGYAYSVEVWKGSVLVGGLYGVNTETYASGESMFHKETNASKLALYKAVQYLSQNGKTWLDTQMVTEVTKSFGAVEISRKEFLRKIAH